MRTRATEFFPFAIAVFLPPAGLLLGLIELAQGEREIGARLVIVAVLAAVVWALLLTR